MDTTVILVPGFWLGAWAWEETEEHLRATGHRTLALTLPGLDPTDPDRASATPDDQAQPLLDALAEAEPAVLVAHSGANVPVTIALDRRPSLVRRVIWVDSGPVGNGNIVNPEAPADLVELPLPEFSVLDEDASLDGLSQEMLDTFRRRAVPEPGAVITTPIRLGNNARYAVPTTLICNSIPGTQLLEMAEAGHPMAAELSQYQDLTAVDLPTGHWPMWSRPKELADAIAQAI